MMLRLQMDSARRVFRVRLNGQSEKQGIQRFESVRASAKLIRMNTGKEIDLAKRV